MIMPGYGELDYTPWNAVYEPYSDWASGPDYPLLATADGPKPGTRG